MKPKSLLLNFLIFALFPIALSANSIVEHVGIVKTSIDVGNSTTVGEVTITPSTAGKVIVHFDGSCISTPGDRIILAASNSTSWSPNDGNVGVEAVDTDLNRNSFSHTRVYDVDAGSHTFYALAHNYVETDGDGIASIYGSLTVEFIPQVESIIGFAGISATSTDVSSATPVGEVTITPSTAGKVIVHFDGSCISTPGDRIILAASNSTSWSPNDGNVGVEAVDTDLNSNSFSHTRVYDVDAGSHTFYALAHNYVETDGNGIASIYGSLTVEFIPQVESIIGFAGISATSTDVSSATPVGEVTITPATSGKVIVHFDGSCISTPGDRIILAASNSTSWSPNDGNVGVEAVDTDLNSNSFSHTRVYDVDAGSHTFYGLAHNYVETDGDGIASIYGSLTVSFFPDDVTSVKEVFSNEYEIYPNPACDFLNIRGLKQNADVSIYSVSGQKIMQFVADEASTHLDISSLVNGIYFINISGDNETRIMKFIKK